MECIICQDTRLEPVIYNTNCSCKYKRHNSCWIDYVHSRKKLICPLCRKELTAKKPRTSIRQSVQIAPMPYAPQPDTIPEESGRQITYQEFIDTIQQYNSTDTVIEVRPSIQPVDMPPNQLPIYKMVIVQIIILGIILTITSICFFISTKKS